MFFFFLFSFGLLHTGKWKPSKQKWDFYNTLMLHGSYLCVLCCCPKASGRVLASSHFHTAAAFGIKQDAATWAHESKSAPKSVPVWVLPHCGEQRRDLEMSLQFLLSFLAQVVTLPLCLAGQLFQWKALISSQARNLIDGGNSQIILLLKTPVMLGNIFPTPRGSSWECSFEGHVHSGHERGGQPKKTVLLGAAALLCCWEHLQFAAQEISSALHHCLARTLPQMSQLF